MAGSVGGRLGQALRSSTYADFREGQPTLVNIVAVSGSASSDLRCQRLSDEWKPGHGFVRTRKDFVRIPKRSDLQ